MSSDGKPLWGFRKIFFLLGVFWLVCGVWTLCDLLFPSEKLQQFRAESGEGNAFSLVCIPVCLIVGAVTLWFWLQLRAQRFTRRNWMIGVFLLLPTALLGVLPGILFLVNWCAQTCQGLFKSPDTQRPVS